jgi:gamma-glutamyltranspeptidase
MKFERLLAPLASVLNFWTFTPSFRRSWNGGDEHIGFGIMGGAVQPLAHAQFVSNFVDYHMNLQEAMEAPRFAKNNAPGCDVAIEFRVPAATLQQLSERGHIVQILREYVESMGRAKRSCMTRRLVLTLRLPIREQMEPQFRNPLVRNRRSTA